MRITRCEWHSGIIRLLRKLLPYGFHTGFDSDNSSGDFSEANHKVAEMLDLDPHQSKRSGEHNGETEIQENGIKKHR